MFKIYVKIPELAVAQREEVTWISKIKPRFAGRFAISIESEHLFPNN